MNEPKAHQVSPIGLPVVEHWAATSLSLTPDDATILPRGRDVNKDPDPTLDSPSRHGQLRLDGRAGNARRAEISPRSRVTRVSTSADRRTLSGRVTRSQVSAEATGDTLTTFVDAFCGAGGLTLGLSEAGWLPTLAFDKWSDAIATHTENLPGHPALAADITNSRQVSAALAKLEDRPDWIVGGPPCQGYSTVGKRIREDERNRLFLAYRDLVKFVAPPGFVLENVLGLRDMSFVDAVKSAFTEAGYHVTAMVLRAADYGVPQLRRRVVFVGHREDRFFAGPRRTHDEHSYVSVDDAIGDLPPVEPGTEATRYSLRPTTAFQKDMRRESQVIQGHRAVKHPERLIEAISHIPDGGNRLHIPDHLQPTSGFHNSYSRLASWKPAVAVTQNMAKPSGTRCIHPRQDRGLTTREGARLQSFPDRFHFSGGAVSQRLQVANAVPPLLAETLGRALEDPARWLSDDPGVSLIPER